MKPRALSVGAVLEDWVAAFAKYGHAKVSASSTATVIEFVLPTLDQAYVSHDDVAALREALEILHLAALVDVASVEEAVAGLCYHSFSEPEDEDEVDVDDGEDTKESPAKNSPSSTGREVEFVLTFYGTPGRFLEETVAPSLFAVRGPRSETYLAARNELLEGKTVPTTPVHCRVNVISMDSSFDDEVEADYIQRVMSFIRRLDTPVNNDANQDDTGDSVPIHVHGIHLELNEMAINKANVEATSALRTTTIPVTCTRVGMNPQSLTCSSVELSSFLDALGAKSPKLTVEIGHVMMSEPTASIDADGASHEELIHTLFQGIFGAHCVTSVSFGPLLAMMSSPANRKMLWRELFACLSNENSKAQVSTLVLSPQIELVDEDAAFIQDAVLSSQPVEIKSLIMWLNQSSAESVQALVRAVGTTTTAVTLHSESHAMTPSVTVETIVRECSYLQRLSLTSAELESMAVLASDKTALRELTLTSVAVQDPSSVTSFLTKLADASTPWAKTMRKLHVKLDNNATDHLALDKTQATIVEQIMTNNKSIRDVELSMLEGISRTTLAAIQSHDGEVLAEPLLLTQKLAFLSATQPIESTRCHHRNRIDEDVVRLIFVFAAERVSRHVHLDF